MLTGTRVEAIERTGSGIVVETSDATLEADLVSVATGVRPESELGSSAGLALGAAGSIAVDAYLRTSDVHI
jgi:NADPH-dependent 2,4-dienoyl-CoA reductase/sulfur reductase-like enzyme